MQLKREGLGPLLAQCALAALVASCGDSNAASVSSVERDSAGITIVEVRGEPHRLLERFDTILSLGGADTAVAFLFNGVVYAARLSTGAVVVIDAGSNETRWFDGDGEHLATAGGSGEGPGEFKRVAEVLLIGDTVVVHDPRNQRVTWLVNGRAARVQRLELNAPPHLVAVGPGSMAVYFENYTSIGRSEYQRIEQTVTLLNVTGTHADTTGVIQGPNRALLVFRYDPRGNPAATLDIELPFTAPLLLAQASDHLFRVDGDQGELLSFTSTGRLTRIVRWPDLQHRVVTNEDRSRYVEYAVRKASSRPRAQLERVRKDAAARLDLIATDHPIPMYDRLLIGSDSTLWLREYETPWNARGLQRWRVLGTDGRPLARVHLPDAFTVMQAGGGYITGVARDTMDVEYVLVLKDAES